MKRQQLLPRVLTGVLVLCAVTLNGSATVWTVNTSGMAFTPQDLTIHRCDTVVWENTEGFHNVRETDTGLFNSGDPADAPWTYQFVFDEAIPTGLYSYQCDIHAFMGMTGTVRVLPIDAQLHLVTASGHAFTPQNLTITQGDTVRWQNTSGIHNVHELGSNLFNSGTPANAPWTYQFVFSNVTPATYNYRCDVHYTTGMVGTVTVEPDQCPVAIVLDPPENLTVAVSGGDAVLRWSEVAGTTSYLVYGSTDVTDAPFTNLIGTSATTTFTHVNAFNLEPIRFYQVRAQAE
jgi:plastocyanin